MPPTRVHMDQTAQSNPPESGGQGGVTPAAGDPSGVVKVVGVRGRAFAEGKTFLCRRERHRFATEERKIRCCRVGSKFDIAKANERRAESFARARCGKGRPDQMR